MISVELPLPACPAHRCKVLVPISCGSAEHLLRKADGTLDIAHQQKRDSITLRLTPDYNGVKDRAGMIREVIQLVQLIRDALPHQAFASAGCARVLNYGPGSSAGRTCGLDPKNA